jgi:hypothetical protein
MKPILGLVMLAAIGSAQVGRTNQPALMLSTYHVLLSSRVGNTFATTSTVSWVCTVEKLDALQWEILTDAGGEWLTVTAADTPAHRPKALTLRADPAGLETGEYHATVRLSAPEKGYEAVTLEVTYVVWRDEGTQIYTLTKQEFVWGESRTLTLTGTRLTGMNEIVLDPAEGIVLEEPRFQATSASARIKVFDGAPTGERTIWLKGPNGETNAFKIFIREQRPYIGEVNPPALHPGRIYVWGRPPFDKEFRVAGMDLGGLEALEGEVEGLAVFMAQDATDAGAFLVVSKDAAPGIRDLQMVMPGIGSMTIPLHVEPTPPQWPEISDLRLEDSYISGNSIVYGGSFKFRDLDGDLSASSISIRFIIPVRGGLSTSRQYAGSLSSATFTVTGTTEGEVRFTIRDQPLFGLYTRYSGDLPVTVTLVDAAGNLSNAVGSIKQQWLVGLF